MSANQYNAIIIGDGHNRGDKSPAQYMEALGAEDRVGFSRFSRTEAGL